MRVHYANREVRINNHYAKSNVVLKKIAKYRFYLIPSVITYYDRLL